MCACVCVCPITIYASVSGGCTSARFHLYVVKTAVCPATDVSCRIAVWRKLPAVQRYVMLLSPTASGQPSGEMDNDDVY